MNRKEANKIIEKHSAAFGALPREAIEAIEYLINAEPQKMGRWIKVTNGRGGHECDVCRTYAPSYTDGDEYLSAFCPYCGAKMEVGENG